MRVVVAGGGIGGLACAQGLRAAGIDVVVVERDRDLRATGGYKLHLGPDAVRALRQLLPGSGFSRLVGSAVGSHGFRLDVRDHRARLLVRVTEAPGELSLDVDRVTLRLILADGLDECLRTGLACTSWSAHDGRVTVTLDNGETLGADVLVVADGADSTLVRPLAGGPTARPTGMIGVAGRTPPTALDARLGSLLGEATMLAVGPGGVGLFAAAHDPATDPPAPTDPPVTDLPPPSVIWGLIAIDRALPPHPQRLPGPVLRDHVVSALSRRRWTSMANGLIRAADSGSIAAYRLWGSDPGALAPWPAGRVTALGDAVHAMPPTGGRGAATAVLDAASLVEHLARTDRRDVVGAVADYEERMRVRAAPAVRESLQPLGWIRGSAHPVGARIVRVALPVVATVAGVTRTLARATR